MAKKDKKKTAKIKVKKKVWCKVYAPAIFGKKEIGESYLTSPEVAVGRRMEVNLRELTGIPRDQHASVFFEITDVKATSLQTKTVGYKLGSAFVKRLVRKNTTRIDDFLRLNTKSGSVITVKPLVIAFGRNQKSVGTEIRAQLKVFLEEAASKVDFETFIQQIVNGKMLPGLKKKLHKVSPVREVSLRAVELQGAEDIIVDESDTEQKVFEEKSESQKPDVAQEVEAAAETQDVDESKEE